MYPEEIFTAKAMIHRIKGALKYCKVPQYEQVLLQLEDDVLHERELDEVLKKLEASCVRLYEVLDHMFPLKSSE